MSKLQPSLAEVREGIRLALWSRRANKFRSFMTILGVMIGVGAVILINTIMDGFNQYTMESIDKIGSHVIYVSKWEENTDFENDTGHSSADISRVGNAELELVLEIM